MGVLKDNYTSFLNDIEKNIKDKEDLDYIKIRFSQFVDVVLDQMDHIMEYKKEEISTLEKRQKEIETKMDKMEDIINNIEKDIYTEDGFDFEIICPYCNYEFMIDVDENKTEIECPECNNIIELDWTGDAEEDTGCLGGNCHTCHNCDDETEEEEQEQDQEENEDDDM